MKISSFATLLGVATIALTTGARAADMPYQHNPGPQVQEFFSAWYLRLDGGYRFNGISGGQALGNSFYNSVLNDSASIGGGVGYKWSWFRADVTGDYGTRPEFSGDTVSGQHVTAKLTNATILLNGYADLGSWWGVTPYLGGGIGYSYLQPAEFVTTSPALPALAADSRWVPSWALTAGVSYAVSPVFLIDASYRYLAIGEAASKVGLIGDVKFGDWTTQEIRFGLRYLIP
jgi:opacity protein-like surface antigen